MNFTLDKIRQFPNATEMWNVDFVEDGAFMGRYVRYCS